MRGSIERFLSPYSLHIVQECRGGLKPTPGGRKWSRRLEEYHLLVCFLWLPQPAFLHRPGPPVQGGTPPQQRTGSPPHTLKAIKKIPTRHAHKSTWQSQIFIECSFFQMTTIVSVKLKKSKTNKHSAFLLFLSSIPSLHVSSTFVTMVTLSFCYPLFEQIFNFWQVSSLVHFFRIYGTQLIVNNCTTWNIHKCSQTPLTKKKI